MSLSKLEQVSCPCGAAFEAELWNAINASEDFELKDSLLSGEINVVCCPACGQIFYAEHFLLYQDAPNELIAFVFPSSFESEAAQCASKMNEDFERAMSEFLPEERVSFKPILVFGVETLVKMLRNEEEVEDEIVILRHIAKDLGISLVNLSPSIARSKHLPRVLPRIVSKKGNLREDILNGLIKLTMHNGHLLHFKKLLNTIEQKKEWTLDLDDVMLKKGK